MAELGPSQYIGQLTPLVGTASSAGYPGSVEGLYYSRPTSNFLVDEGDIGDSYLLSPVPVLPVPAVPSPQLVVYRMRGKDVDCATLTYRYWYAVGAPDLSASLYIGPKCGVSPLAEVKVVENVSS